MSGIEFDDYVWSDPRFVRLILALGSEMHAAGALIIGWRLAQKHWRPGKKEDNGRRPIPHDEWASAGMPEAVIDTGWFRVDESGVWARGAEKAFGWLFQRKEAGQKGGKISAEVRWGNKNEATSDNQIQATAKQSLSECLATAKQPLTGHGAEGNKQPLSECLATAKQSLSECLATAKRDVSKSNERVSKISKRNEPVSKISKRKPLPDPIRSDPENTNSNTSANRTSEAPTSEAPPPPPASEGCFQISTGNGPESGSDDSGAHNPTPAPAIAPSRAGKRAKAPSRSPAPGSVSLQTIQELWNAHKSGIQSPCEGKLPKQIADSLMARAQKFPNPEQWERAIREIAAWDWANARGAGNRGWVADISYLASEKATRWFAGAKSKPAVKGETKSGGGKLSHLFDEKPKNPEPRDESAMQNTLDLVQQIEEESKKPKRRRV